MQLEPGHDRICGEPLKGNEQRGPRRVQGENERRMNRPGSRMDDE